MSYLQILNIYVLKWTSSVFAGGKQGTVLTICKAFAATAEIKGNQVFWMSNINRIEVLCGSWLSWVSFTAQT